MVKKGDIVMGNFEFKSQICTTKEQSEKLLALGLKKETADMTIHIKKDNSWYVTAEPFYEWEDDMNTLPSWEEPELIIPAWSLHRLMEIAMKGDKLGCITHNIHQNNVSTYYELVIASIEHLIKIDKFNKDYLEESQCEK